MPNPTTRERIQRIRHGATRHAQQDLARLEGERQVHAMRLSSALQAMEGDPGDEVAMVALREACMLRYLPEVRRLEASAVQAQQKVTVQSERVLDAWRSEKLADELLSQEQSELRIVGRRRDDRISAETSSVRWWRERAA